MEVFYKCSCIPAERGIVVPNRPEGCDLMLWMGIVQSCIGFDHHAVSPTCKATSMEYAKIPIPEADRFLGHNAKPN